MENKTTLVAGLAALGILVLLAIRLSYRHANLPEATDRR